MKTIQLLLLLVFISGSSILMINSGKVNPQIEKQYNSYWTVIANAQTESISTFEAPEPKQFSPSVGIESTRSTGYYQTTGRGRENSSNRNLSAGNRKLPLNEPLNPLHSRIIQSPLQPMDLIISPQEAADYAATLDAKMQYVNKR